MRKALSRSLQPGSRANHGGIRSAGGRLPGQFDSRPDEQETLTRHRQVGIELETGRCWKSAGTIPIFAAPVKPVPLLSREAPEELKEKDVERQRSRLCLLQLQLCCQLLRNRAPHTEML